MKESVLSFEENTA